MDPHGRVLGENLGQTINLPVEGRNPKANHLVKNGINCSTYQLVSRISEPSTGLRDHDH